MRMTFDPIKNARNAQERGLSFNRVAEFDFATSLVHEDMRSDDPQPRWIALGFQSSAAFARLDRVGQWQLAPHVPIRGQRR